MTYSRQPLLRAYKGLWRRVLFYCIRLRGSRGPRAATSDDVHAECRAP